MWTKTGHVHVTQPLRHVSGSWVHPELAVGGPPMTSESVHFGNRGCHGGP